MEKDTRLLLLLQAISQVFAEQSQTSTKCFFKLLNLMVTIADPPASFFGQCRQIPQACSKVEL
jgi:hypothetical protein